MKTAGFSMIELLLYISIMALIIGCVTTTLMFTYINALKEQRVLHEWCMLSTASDVFAHDICAASDARDAWYQPDEHTVIGRCGSTDICWTLRKGKLVRLSGIYERATHRWRKRTISVAATGVTACTFTLVPDKQVQRINAVQCAVTGQATTVTRTVAIRIGRLV